MEELNLSHKKNGETLDCSEWNKLVSVINYIIDFYNAYPTKLSEFENDSKYISENNIIQIIQGLIDNGTLPRTQGDDGKSAYELAVEEGFMGTKQLWLSSLLGAVGKSAYELAVENGFSGSVQLWIASLKGEDGIVGSDGQDGLDGITPHIDPSTKHWMIRETDTGVVAEGQDGSDGLDGLNGVDGKSAYQSYVETTNDFPIKTEALWIASLKGADGINGTNGADGKSAYQSYLDTTTDNPPLTELQWANNDYNNLKNKPNLATVATSGSYNDLTNKPEVITKSDINMNGVSYGGYTFIDLGLPSGTLWANRNIGENETSSGDYFRLAEITPYDKDTDPGPYLFSTHRYMLQDSNPPELTFLSNEESIYIYEHFTKTQKYYTNISSTSEYCYLDSTEDAATNIIGNDCLIPTEEQILELINNTSIISSDNELILLSNINGNKINITPRTVIKNNLEDVIGTGNNIPCFYIVSNKIEKGVYDPTPNEEYYTDPEFMVECFYRWRSLGPWESTPVLEPRAYFPRAVLIRPVLTKKFLNFSPVASSGDYNDLSNKPTIPATQILADWNQTDNSALDYIKNKPTIPSSSGTQVQADWNQSDNSLVDYIKNKPSLATVATTGSYKDLNNSPGMFEANGHDYVEIAGIKWATMNLGANSVTDFGLYYQWGDTQGYTSAQVGNEEGLKYFGWEDYKYGNETSNPGIADMTKYNATDGLTILEESDDAIKAAWGGTWRLPTKEEFTTLYYNTNKSYQYDYLNSGVSGLLLTDKTDSNKQIFFPYAGYLSDGTFNENDGIYYWTNCLYSSYPTSAFYVQFYLNSGLTSWGYKSRKFGYNIRGVLNDGLSNVAFTGRYKDLINKPVIPAALILANWNQTNNNAVDYIKNKPSFAKVATSGSYRDLIKKPTIPEYTELKKEIFVTPTILYPQNGEYNLRTFIFDFTGQHLYNPFKNLRGKLGYIKYFINNRESYTRIIDEIKYPEGGSASYEEDYWIFSMGPYENSTDNTYNIRIETDYNQEYLKNIKIYLKGDIKHSELEGVTPCYFVFGEANFIINSTVNNSFSLQPDWKEINKASITYIKNKPGYTIANGHDYVEIGGIKWATMNVGANNITDRGNLYFLWGDTLGYTAGLVGSEEGKKYFGWDDYKFRANTNEFRFTKYGEIDGKLLLEDSDDAVTAAWGGNWRLPTKREYLILLDSVTLRSSLSGLYLVDKTDPNKELFFPFGGWVDNGHVRYNGGEDTNAWYMSKELHVETNIEWDGDSRNIDSFYIGYSYAHISTGERHIGYLIRGVLDDLNDFSTVAFTGDYNDLINKPTIPASSGTSTQIQADWDLSDNTALDYIKNKPTIPAALVQSDWNATTGPGVILNKPTIPTVPANETATNGGNTLSVVTTGDKYNWNNKASIWSGTQAQYDALSPNYDSNTIYIITASS